MSLVALNSLAGEVFGFDLPAHLNDDMVAAKLLEYLGGADKPGQSGPIAAAAAAAGTCPRPNARLEQAKECH